MAGDHTIVPVERIEQVILLIRRHGVILDKDLAMLYGVTTGNLNKAVIRNIKRFPADFMFQFTSDEFENLKFHFGTSSWGGTRKLPRAFTEQGVAMLSSVLRSSRAVSVNVEIMRAFVRLRQMLASHADLARKLDALEKKYDAQFRAVFDAIREVPVAVNQGFIAMVCDKRLPNHYVRLWARENMDAIVANANGTTFLEISKKNFRPVSVLVPPKPVLIEFVRQVKPLHRRMVSTLKEARTLAALRDALLPKLMSGEIRVTKAENFVEVVP